MRKPKNFLLLTCLVLVILACQTLAVNQPTLSGKDLYLKLRDDALKIKPETLGLKVDLNGNIPYGVIMDDGLNSDITTTIAGYMSGDAYLLTNSGAGRMDGIKYESVKSAAQKFVSTASNFIDRMKPVADYSLPSINHVKFYVLTPTGIYASEELNKDDLITKSNPFYRLYYAEQDIVTAFRLSS